MIPDGGGALDQAGAGVQTGAEMMCKDVYMHFDVSQLCKPDSEACVF